MMFSLRCRSLMIVAFGLVSLLFASSPRAAQEASPEGIHVLVLREHGVGSARTAQGYLDKLIEVVAKVNAWPAASGTYHTDRKRAQGYIDASKPEFGILSLGAFLALRKPEKLELVGRAELRAGGGAQYYLISKSATKAEECKGKTLATTFSDDEAFVDRVVFEGSMALSDFEVQPLKRPLQPLQAVARGQAECAFVDDGQLAELGHMSEGEGIRPIWFSSKFPPLVIVAFPSAKPAQVKRFEASLPQVCSGDGQAACTSTGLVKLVPIEPKALAAVIRAYEQR